MDRNQETSLFSSHIYNLESILGGLGNYGNGTATVKWLSELKALRPEAKLSLTEPLLCEVGPGKATGCDSAAGNLQPPDPRGKKVSLNLHSIN